MGTIAEKLNYLNTTKTNIKNAIVAKGVSVSENDTFRSYASKIVDIEPTLGTKTITANGTYTASDDSLQGYSSVTVDIDDTDLYRDTTDSTYESVKTLSNCGAFPMLSLTAEINAVQDLHGYDKPWAGGANVNLFNIDNCTLNAEYYAPDGTITSNIHIRVSEEMALPNGDYCISWSGSSETYVRVNVLDSSGTFLRREATTVTSPIVFTLSGTDAKVQLAIDETITALQLEEGTTATPYSPYSNICPISGWDSIDVYQSGADTSNPTTYTTALSTTCYGGSKDIKGNEIFTHAIVDLGALTWSYDATYSRFSANVPNITVANPGSLEMMCSQYECISDGRPIQRVPDGSFYNSTCGLYIHDSRYTDATAFKTAMDGVQVVYPLATPTTATSDAIDLTLAEGVNNVWANSGDVGDARYFKKIEL